MPQGRHQPEPLLSLVEGVFGGGQEAAGRGDTACEAASDEVKGLRTEAEQLKELLAEVRLENRLLKKRRDRWWGVRYMRYAAAEKLEIIRLVEQSSLPVRRTLAQLGISRARFYRWYQRYLARGAVALADGQPARGGSGTSFRKW